MSKVTDVIEKVGDIKKFSNLSIDEIKEIRKALTLVNNFNKNINKYGKHIFESEYLLSTKELQRKLPENDLKKLGIQINSNLSGRYVYCYKKKCLYNFNWPSGWIMGAISLDKTTYSFDEENRLVVQIDWKTQSARFNHVPWISRQRTLVIDLQTREVVSDKGDGFCDFGR
jgi:hypothetical protein